MISLVAPKRNEVIEHCQMFQARRDGLVNPAAQRVLDAEARDLDYTYDPPAHHYAPDRLLRLPKDRDFKVIGVVNQRLKPVPQITVTITSGEASGVFHQHIYGYDCMGGVFIWPNRDPLNELGFEAFRSHYTRKGKPTRGDGDNLYKFVDNSPISKWDYLGLDNPGCDFPATSLPCTLPGAADCYLRCCAQHDACLGEQCTAASSWAQILCPTPCGHCARQVVGCFANCMLGGNGPDNPPYYCHATGKYYYHWDDMMGMCWESGQRPEAKSKPDCYP
jgi:hypothetical protein